MRTQILLLSFLLAILGATAKDISSDRAEVKNEEDLLVDTETLDRQIRSVRAKKKPSKKPGKKPGKKPSGKSTTTLKPALASSPTPTLTPNPTTVEGTGGNNVEDVVGETTQCAITQADVNASINMPNVNYFLRGYNIMKGNPHQVSVSSVDPGFQEPIFSLCYDQGGETPDGRYLQPDGTIITMCQSCSLSAVTKITSGMTDYIDSLSEKVKVTGRYVSPWSWWEHRFSWSKEYKNIHSGIYEYMNYYTHSDESCCAYQIQTDTYSHPPFSKNFIDGVETLPSVYNEKIYRKFIEAFGTHYIKQADMGSLFGQQTKISKESWDHMVSSSLNIEKASSWSAMFASGSYNTTDIYETSRVSEFNNWASSQLLYTKGSKPPKSNSIKNWIDETKKYPAPISLELGSILDLFDGDYRRENIKEALDNYCGSNCEEHEDDPWLTNISVGQRSEPKSCDGGNVTWVQFFRGPLWYWPTEGIHDLCFKCSNDDTMQCFNEDTTPPGDNVVGLEMICPENGFERMTTFTPYFYDNNPINVKAHCNRDAEPQYAFYGEFLGTWAPWVSCHHDSKITGFQVLRNWDKIVNFRIKCE